jgi:hypothetical protein
MSRASCAQGWSVAVASPNSSVAPFTALTMSSSPVPVGKQAATPFAFSVSMSSAGRIPPM